MENNSNRDNKKIAKNTMYLYARMLVAMALSVYTSRLILEALGETDFGIYNVVAGISVFLNFLNGTLVASCQRFLNMSLGEKSTEKTCNIYNASIRIHIALSIIVFIAAESIGLWIVNNLLTIPSSRMFAANIIYQTSILVVLSSIIQSPFQAMILAKEKMQLYAVISIIDIIFKFVFAVGLLYIIYDKLIVYGISMAFIGVIILLLNIKLCFGNFEECKFISKLQDKTIYKKMLGFSGWAMIGSISGMLLNQGINILLNIFSGPVVNAARALSMTLNNYVYSFVNNFTVAFSPQLIKLYASKEYDELSDLLTQSIKYSVFLFSFFALPVLFEANFILQIWLKDVPDYTSIFCRIVVLSSFISCAERPMATVCNAIGCVKNVNLSVGILYLFSFFVSWFLLYMTGNVIYPFIVHLLTITIGVSIFLFYIHKYVKINRRKFFSSILLKPISVLVIPLLLLIIVTNYMSENWIRFIVVGLISTISISSCIFCFGLNSNERSKLLITIKKKLCSKKLRGC